METAAAAIANMIAYNIAAARAESAAHTVEETHIVPAKTRGFFPSVARNWDVVAVCLMMGSFAIYGATQFRI